jgi:hypothetical protein
MYRLMFVLGCAVGYVLGTKAGRQRYEQIARTARKVKESPTVQSTAGVLGAQASDLAGKARGKARGALHLGSVSAQSGRFGGNGSTP